VVYYASTIFQALGFQSGENATLASLGIGIAKVCFEPAVLGLNWVSCYSTEINLLSVLIFVFILSFTSLLPQ